MPRLSLRYRALAPDVQLNARLWDVAPGGTQTLVTRGAYRAVAPNLAGDSAEYDLFGNHWRFEPGHRLMLEVTADDSPYLRRDNFPAVATIDERPASCCRDGADAPRRSAVAWRGRARGARAGPAAFPPRRRTTRCSTPARCPTRPTSSGTWPARRAGSTAASRPTAHGG